MGSEYVVFPDHYLSLNIQCAGMVSGLFFRFCLSYRNQRATKARLFKTIDVVS